MEVLGVTASVVGIITFTVQGLKIMSQFREFCKDFKEESTISFLHEINVTAGILGEVKDLCEKIDRLHPNGNSDYRIASLQVQVEDCTQDMQGLLDHVTRRRSARSLTKVVRMPKDFLGYVAHNARASLHDRIRRHQDNMRTALAMIGRRFDVDNYTKLNIMKDGLQKLTDKFTLDAQNKSRALQSLSSSGSAMLALSRSTNARLGDVQTTSEEILSEMSDVKELLLEILSGSSLSSLGGRSDQESPPPANPADSLKIRIATDHQKKQSHATPHDLDKLNELDELELLNVRTQHSNTDDIDLSEWGLVLRASEQLAHMAQNTLHPYLADYACLLHVWHTHSDCAQLLRIEPSSRSWVNYFDYRSAVAKIHKAQQQVQTRILALRKKCFVEGLQEDMAPIETLMSITEDDFESWEYNLHLHTVADPLVLKNPHNAEDQKRDRITRINEWLLHIRQAHPYLVQMHRDFYHAIDKKRGELEVHLLSTDWERLTLKFWFLDAAALMDEEDYAASSVGGDSDATMMPLTDTAEDDDIRIVDFGNESRQVQGVLDLTTSAPHSAIPIRLDGPIAKELEFYIESATGHFDQDSTIIDSKVLEDYNNEAAASVNL